MSIQDKERLDLQHHILDNLLEKISFFTGIKMDIFSFFYYELLESGESLVAQSHSEQLANLNDVLLHKRPFSCQGSFPTWSHLFVRCKCEVPNGRFFSVQCSHLFHSMAVLFVIDSKNFKASRNSSNQNHSHSFIITESKIKYFE